MSFKRRRKASRFRGSHTHGRGFKKKARGSGHQGGKGMAGTGKRGDQKKSLIINLFGNDYFKRDKALRRGRPKVRPIAINLGDLELKIDSFIKQGKAKESKGTYDLDLKEYKILGNGEIKLKLNIKAHSASGSAREKIKKAGGSITTQEPKTEDAIPGSEKVPPKAK